MKRLGAAIVLSLLAWPAAAAEPGRDLRLCYEDQVEWSWIRPAQGLDSGYVLLQMVKAKLGLNFDYVGLPWKRCLSEMQEGHVDGAVGASFVAERQVMGAYPTDAQGRPDPTRRLAMNGYHLYVPKGSDLGWDGQHFSNLHGPIATIVGYSIIEQLKASGATVYEMGGGENQTLGLFQLTIGGHAQAAAMITAGGDAVLHNHPEIAAQMVKYPVPLAEKPYYLMFSHQRVEADPALTERIWSAMAEVRDTPEYVAALQAERGQ